MPVIFAFFLYPILELWLFFKLASLFGFWTIFLISLIVSALGVSLLIAKWQTMLTDLASGTKITLTYLINSATDAFAGILIMLPGFITFALGILLLIPLTKDFMVKFFLRIFNLQDITFTQYDKRHSTFESDELFKNQTNQQTETKGRVFEGEIVQEQDKPKIQNSNNNDK